MLWKPRWKHVLDAIAEFFPHWPMVWRRSFSLWLYGAAQSGCVGESSVLATMATDSTQNSIRRRLRYFLSLHRPSSVSNNAPLTSESFTSLTRALLADWPSDTVFLGFDATSFRGKSNWLVFSVLVHQTAIPLAWWACPIHAKGSWTPAVHSLSSALAAGIPKDKRVVLMMDRGLSSPEWFDFWCRLGWTPLMRVQRSTKVQQDKDNKRLSFSELAKKEQTVEGTGRLGRPGKTKRRKVGYAVVWEKGYNDYWCLVWPKDAVWVNPRWYRMRSWIECSFRTQKSMGFRWERGRRSDLRKQQTHYFVLAVLMAWGAMAANKPLQRPEELALDSNPRRSLSLPIQSLIAIRHWFITPSFPAPSWFNTSLPFVVPFHRTS